MKKLIFLFLLLPALVQAQTELIEPLLTGNELIEYLQNNYSVTNEQSYNSARDAMFEEIDGPDGMITCVYTGFTISFTDRSDAQGSQASDDFNTEHVWPQSFFDSELPMRSDIHHLFPTRVDVNGARSNFPFDEIPDNETDTWWRTGDISRSSIPTSNIDEYSELLNGTSFEPREDLKGNVARAIFYFWTIYQDNSSISADSRNEPFFEEMQDVLLQWHLQDEVDSEELARSLQIEEVQGNRNPFIHDTTLVRRAYFGGAAIVEDTLANPIRGMITAIDDDTFEFDYVEDDSTISITFSFTEQVVVLDTLGAEYELTQYPSLYDVEVSWVAGSAQNERVAETVRIFEFEEPGTTSNEFDWEIIGFKVDQNYPNPFNPATTITYSIENAGHVKITVYSATGSVVATLLDETKLSGTYQVQFSGQNLASGLYFYRVDFNGYSITRKMTLLK